MTRRRRIMLLLVAIVVAVPVLAAVVVGSYLRSGGLEREIEHRWETYGMPGRLSVGRIRLVGIDKAVAEDLVITGPNQPELVRVARADVTLDLFDRRLVASRLTGVEGGLDAPRYRYLRDVIRAEQRHPSTRAPKPVRIEVVDAAVLLPGGLALTGCEVEVDALGAKAQVRARAQLDGRPVRLAIATDRATYEAPVVTTITVEEGSASPAAVLVALEGMGIIKSVPPEAGPWLPAVADVAGSTVAVDAVSDTFRGQVQARWQGGQADAELDADARRIVLRRLRVEDARLGSATGVLTADRHGTWVAIDAADWRAGGGLPVPQGLPLADMARLLPGLEIRWPVAGTRTSLAVVGPGRARLEVLLGGADPIRITAAEVPLVMVQNLVPPPLVLGGGHIVAASATLAESRPEFSATLRQARLLADGWSFGPFDGLCAAVIEPGGTVQVSAELLSGEAPIGSITFAGSARQARVTVTCSAVEALLTRVRGPAQLPDLLGSVALDARYELQDDALAVRVNRLDLADGRLRLASRDFAQGVATRMSGSARIGGGQVEVDLGGHLRSGALRIPGDWLNVAARTPLFSFDVVATSAEGRLAELTLRRAMVRAATPEGEPQAGGYSAQIEGRLAGENLAGRAVGIIDHADLAWITGLVVPGEVKVGGEGAVAFQAMIDGGEVRRIDGTFLPLGADLDIERGKLRVGGITGAVRFTLGGEPTP